MTYHVVAQVEHNGVTLTGLERDDEVHILGSVEFAPDLRDETGGNLFRQVDTQVARLLKQLEVSDDPPVPVHVVLPGSLEGELAIVGSSRLNVRSRCCPNELLASRQYRLINDVYASARGQLLYNDAIGHDWKDKVVAFVFVHEGVGSAIFHRGERVCGAGYAGPLGLCIVEPQGQYYDEFRARGALESYCSRPWMSANIVNRHFTGMAKKTIGERQVATSPFTRALDTMTLENKRNLTYEIIDAGVTSNHHIALAVLQEATDYLARTLSHLIVAINPHVIVLDGRMVHEVSQFFELTMRNAQMYTFPAAWNATAIVKAHDTDNVVVFGALDDPATD